MTTLLNLLTTLAWWTLIVAFAGVLSVATVAVFFHAFPNGGDDR